MFRFHSSGFRHAPSALCSILGVLLAITPPAHAQDGVNNFASVGAASTQQSQTVGQPSEDEVRNEMLNHPWVDTPIGRELCSIGYCDQAHSALKKIGLGQYSVVKPIQRFGDNPGALLAYLRNRSSCRNTRFMNVFPSSQFDPGATLPPPYYPTQNISVYPVYPDNQLLAIAAEGHPSATYAGEDMTDTRRFYFLLNLQRCTADYVIGPYKILSKSEIANGNLDYESPIEIDDKFYFVNSFRFPELYHSGHYLYFFSFGVVNEYGRGVNERTFDQGDTFAKAF